MAVIAASRDPRLVGYVTAVMLLVSAGLLFGQPAFVAAAMPFATTVLWGVRVRGPVTSEVTVHLEEHTVLEGDEVVGAVRVRVPGPLHAIVHLDHGSGWQPTWPLDGTAWHMPPETGDDGVFALTASEWGRASLGTVRVAMRAPGGLLTWDAEVPVEQRIRVLPPVERVRELLPPPESKALLGAHTSRSVGDGFDFAEIRAFTPGDRLRDLNWWATARTDEPQVNRRHPERNGEVVLLIDTFADGLSSTSITQQRVISRAAHAGWSVAQLHLAAQDRVGLVTRGRLTRQLPPGTGNRARYALLEALLDIGTALHEGEHDRVDASRLRVSPAALVIALTPLTRPDIVDDLRQLRHGGRSVVVVVVETLDLLPPPSDHADQRARRMLSHEWRLSRTALADEGFPVTVWSADSSLADVVGALRRTQQRRMRRR